jgi:hypothetical protein
LELSEAGTEELGEERSAGEVALGLLEASEPLLPGACWCLHLVVPAVAVVEAGEYVAERGRSASLSGTGECGGKRSLAARTGPG